MIPTVRRENSDNTQTVSDLVSVAARHVADGNVDAAHSLLSDAATHAPTYIPLQFVASLLAWRMGDFAKSLELARTCHMQDSMNGTIAEVLASLYALVGNLRESLFHGKLAIALKPDEKMSKFIPADFPSFDISFLNIQDRPLFAFAKFLHAQGKFDKALDYARQHVEVAPEDQEARLFYVDFLLQLGQAAKAIEIIRPLRDGGGLSPSAASLYARALTATGEFSEALRWHDEACLGKPQDAEIAAARLADLMWVENGREKIFPQAVEWIKKFTKTPAPARRHSPRDKLVIGYLVSNFSDRKDAAAVAAVARAHSRANVEVIGYGIGAQTWSSNLALSGAFDRWHDIAGLDWATLARTLSGDGLHVVIDVGGITAPGNVQALARSTSIARVAWLHDPAGFETIYDAVIASHAADDVGKFHPWTVGWGAYPLWDRDGKRRERTAKESCHLGADIQLCQLNAKTVELWSAILRVLPQSVLLLRDNDMSSKENVHRLVQRFGHDLASRIDIVSAVKSVEFYSQVDIALTPMYGSSPRAVAEALSYNVPTVALDRCRRIGSYGGMLGDLGLGELLVASTPEDYVEKAKLLALSDDRYSRAVAAIGALKGKRSALEIATAIEKAAREFLTEIAA